MREVTRRDDERRLRRASKTEKRRRNGEGKADGVGKRRGKIRGTARNSARNTSTVFAFHARARALVAAAFQRSRRGEFRHPLPFCRAGLAFFSVMRRFRDTDDVVRASGNARRETRDPRSLKRPEAPRFVRACIACTWNPRVSLPQQPFDPDGQVRPERNMGVSRRCSLLSILR